MIHKAYAKVNVFLKIVGKRGSYHEILSRFVLVDGLYDVLRLQPKTSEEYFELVGEFGCALQSNTIYKALMAFSDAGYKEAIDTFCAKYALHVEKNIPSFAGLGGGSSDAATFLLLLNEFLHVNLSKEELSLIGSKVGADVPFFIYGYKSANVSGIGEVVKEFKEEPLHVKTFTPDIKCDTAKVYKAFREHYKVDVALAQKMADMSSNELVKRYDALTLNDLFGASLSVYPELAEYKKDGWFFSGSGSSFFKIVDN
jgi:4-diphosphocytidyl-2-C-methyl-D-erythritol kinase